MMIENSSSTTIIECTEEGDDDTWVTFYSKIYIINVIVDEKPLMKGKDHKSKDQYNVMIYQ